MRSLSLVLAAHTLALLLILPPGVTGDAEDSDDDKYEFECDSMGLCFCNKKLT